MERSVEEVGVELVAINAKIVRRFREIEQAADLEPGSVLASMLEAADNWWAEEDAGTLEDWIGEGWDLADPMTVKANLRALRAEWLARRM